MIITVTQEDIDNGVCKDSCQCPVALAVQQTLGDFTATVSRTTIRSTRRTVELPTYVRLWIRIYDKGLPVEPFSFEVSL